MRRDGEDRVPCVKGPQRIPGSQDNIVHQNQHKHLQAMSTEAIHQNKSGNPRTKKKNDKHKGPSQVKMAPQDGAGARLELIPQEVIERYRLTPDQIRQLDRFKDYSPGEPSEVQHDTLKWYYFYVRRV